MKSVMLSIQPKWVEKIVKGEKTIEVRKTRPKIKTPFKCYIYCTYGQENENYMIGKRGKVIGDFVCDRIYDIKPYCDIGDYVNQYECGWKYGEDFHCLSFSEMKSYLKNKKGYGWHISELKIYDKPKELFDFANYNKYQVCKERNCFSDNCWICDNNALVIRPPQSYMYVEEV